MHKERRYYIGFTLIELMITVAVVGILAAVAYPSYFSYLQKGRRADAQAYLLNIAQKQQQYFTDSRSFSSDIASLNETTPNSVSSYYTITISVPTSTTFVITATPKLSQTSDGVLTIDNSGSKTPSSKW